MKKYLLLGIIIFLAFFLRVYQLDKVPPSLYWDEASLGYNAYSISQTLRDEHGEFLPLTRFMAFGDYKAPGYIYAAAISIKLLGLSDFTIRFPSALAGTLLVVVSYLLVSELGFLSNWDKKFTGLLGYCVTGLLAISPWSLQFSRGAFEANLATLFSGLGIYLFLRAIRSKSSLFFLLSSFFFVLSMYTFNSHRIFVPLILFALALIFFRDVLAQWKRWLPALVLFAILLFPLAKYGTTREAQLRFQEVAWVNDLAPIQTANDLIARDGNTWWSNIIHNRRIVYAQEFLAHYTDQVKANFLFYSGDENKRLSIQTVGELYWLDLPFLLVGLYFLLWNWKQKGSQVILTWLLLAPVPAALARETPHALRALTILPIPQIIVAIGMTHFLLKLPKFLKSLRFPIFFLYLVSCLLYLKDYYTVYPAKYAPAWQYGYKQIVQYATSVENNYQCISVTQYYGRPYIYFLLYNHYDPAAYWAARNVSRDWYGFWYVHSFAKYRFGDIFYPGENCLYIRAPKDIPKGAKVTKTVNDLEGQPVFKAFEMP